jgi:hypothetical protein
MRTEAALMKDKTRGKDSILATSQVALVTSIHLCVWKRCPQWLNLRGTKRRGSNPKRKTRMRSSSGVGNLLEKTHGAGKRRSLANTHESMPNETTSRY